MNYFIGMSTHKLLPAHCYMFATCGMDDGDYIDTRLSDYDNCIPIVVRENPYNGPDTKYRIMVCILPLILPTLVK